jgi:integrase
MINKTLFNIFGSVNLSMKSIYLSEQKLKDVISCMNYQNGLAIRVCNATGLRLSDVLAIRYAQLIKTNRITVREQKTGKSRRLYVPVRLQRELLYNAKGIYCFPHRRDMGRPPTRQAVYMDFKKACRRLGINPTGISPHSVRKTWAVREYAKTRSITHVQKKLNHNHSGVTALYALSDKL